MTNSTIAHQRLANQRIAADPFERPADVVQWLGAVQAQDYAGAKWSLGRRMRAATDEIVEQAFTAGAILRTHVLRPTWHFVTPADIHWLLALTAPRVHALNAPLYRKLEIDHELVQRSTTALTHALQGGNQLTRDEVRGVLAQAGIATAGEFRMSYILMRAELNGVVCSGAAWETIHLRLAERACSASATSGARPSSSRACWSFLSQSWTGDCAGFCQMVGADRDRRTRRGGGGQKPASA